MSECQYYGFLAVDRTIPMSRNGAGRQDREIIKFRSKT